MLKTSEWVTLLLMSKSEVLSVPFLKLIKLCYTKTLEWSSLVLDPKAKSSSSEITNPTSFIVSYQKGWCWSWNSSSLTTWCEELTPWKRLWSWERLKAGREGDTWGYHGWMASLTRWTWVWTSFGSWWFTRKPGMLQFMGSQRFGHHWVIELKLIQCADLEHSI